MEEISDIDFRDLTNEVLGMMIDNGLEEPWLMALVDRLVMSLGECGDVHLYCGKRGDEDFVGVDIGLLSNVFSYEAGVLVYYIISNITLRVEKMMEVSLDGVGNFSEVIDGLFRHLEIQIQLERIYSSSGDIDEFDRLLNELL